jgi:hypothetical protein
MPKTSTKLLEFPLDVLQEAINLAIYIGFHEKGVEIVTFTPETKILPLEELPQKSILSGSREFLLLFIYLDCRG